jgi:hypothetical protein
VTDPADSTVEQITRAGPCWSAASRNSKASSTTCNAKLTDAELDRRGGE